MLYFTSFHVSIYVKWPQASNVINNIVQLSELSEVHSNFS